MIHIILELYGRFTDQLRKVRWQVDVAVNALPCSVCLILSIGVQGVLQPAQSRAVLQVSSMNFLVGPGIAGDKVQRFQQLPNGSFQRLGDVLLVVVGVQVCYELLGDPLHLPPLHGLPLALIPLFPVSSPGRVCRVCLHDTAGLPQQLLHLRDGLDPVGVGLQPLDLVLLDLDAVFGLVQLEALLVLQLRLFPAGQLHRPFLLQCFQLGIGIFQPLQLFHKDVEAVEVVYAPPLAPLAHGLLRRPEKHSSVGEAKLPLLVLNLTGIFRLTILRGLEYTMVGGRYV